MNISVGIAVIAVSLVTGIIGGRSYISYQAGKVPEATLLAVWTMIGVMVMNMIITASGTRP